MPLLNCARKYCGTPSPTPTRKLYICSFFRSMSNNAAGPRNGSMGAPSTLQSLFDYTRQMFQQHKGRDLAPKLVSEVNQRLCSIPLSELGLQPPEQGGPSITMQTVAGKLKELEGLRQQQGYKANITYLHIFEDTEMSVGIFCLPAGAVIPLHDHPGMTVFSRVLYGQLFVQAFDWVNGAEMPSSQRRKKEQAQLPVELQDSSSDVSEEDLSSRPACLVVARVQGPEDVPMVLFPHSHGNIHSFTALSDCAILDVLSPPYDSKYGRDCTYYFVESQMGKEKGQVVLGEYDPPEDFEVVRGVYKGVPLVVREAGKKRFNMKRLSDIADNWHV